MYYGLYMLQKLTQNDKLLLVLLQNSSLTNTQLDTILSYITVRHSDGKLEEMLVVRDGPKITKGSFLRTLKQARDNVKKSIYSILILSYLGVLDTNFVMGFGKVVDTFQELRTVGEINDPDQVVRLIDILCDKLLNM